VGSTQNGHFELVQASSFAYWNTGPATSLFPPALAGEGSFARQVGEHASVMVRFFYEDRNGRCSGRLSAT